MDQLEKNQYQQFRARRFLSAEHIAREQCSQEYLASKIPGAWTKLVEPTNKSESSKQCSLSNRSNDGSEAEERISDSPTSSESLEPENNRACGNEFGFDEDNDMDGSYVDKYGGSCDGICKNDDSERVDFSSTGDLHRSNVIAKIVRHLKERHLRKDNTPLNIDEILDETRQMHVLSATKRWLIAEGLPANPKVEVAANGTKFMFKPPYKLTDGKSLMRLLKHYDLKGLGGIMGDDLLESLPNCEKYLNRYADDLICIERPSDKKKIYFYKDKSPDLGIDEEFKRLWRTCNMEGLDNDDINDDFEKFKPDPKSKQKRKKKIPIKLDNTHVSDILEEYDVE